VCGFTVSQSFKPTAPATGSIPVQLKARAVSGTVPVNTLQDAYPANIMAVLQTSSNLSTMFFSFRLDTPLDMARGGACLPDQLIALQA
jgi:Na+/H+-dicarboxylate symporter